MSGSIDHEFDFVSISNGQTICQVKEAKNPEDNAGMEDEEDPSRELPKVRTCLKVVCGDSFEAVFGSIRRMVWVMAVVICCFFMISQMSECLDKLSNPPISTQTRIIMKEEMDYPALTMCYKNSDNQGYDPLMFKHYNITRYWLMNDQTQESTWRNFPWGEISLSEVWENITYPVVETSDSVQYQGHRDHIKSYVTSINNVGGLDYTYTFYHDHGRCYTIRPPKNVDKPLPGEKYGYKLYFYLQRSSNDSKLFDGEWQVHVHDADEWWSENSLLSYSHQETLYVKTGYRVFIRVTESVFNSLNRPQEPCDDVGATSYNECIETCRWRHIVSQESIRCKMPFMEVPGWPECDTQDQAFTAIEQYRNYRDKNAREHCKSSCLKHCRIRIHSAQITKEMESRPDQSSIHIYYSSGMIQDLHEEWGYDMTLFIADFGGSLGFLLGVSILSVLEIVEGLILAAYQMCQDRRETKERKASQEADEEGETKEAYRPNLDDAEPSNDWIGVHL